ncbi:hypothetical protein B1A99_29730 [Cohnella sp. CIP 111063]|uniref:hypothetical protein n=1 Tax=unclassified Cohnella TaxID=2636738 RepID=UPI000B8BCB8F|nr:MULTISPECIES: hypothetical protein [unclassified Cohnella]OXS53552.1 hypothetical protein B1A99_29730 [Cohnella sp. CIP 111063]PRX61580.1 hypothetical protein B0G52_125102 [Cohnella sp. SGD-V74]
MAETTPNLGLNKPVENEHADVAVINSNMDKIDQTLGDMASVPTTAKDAAGAISELFTNVSDGKALIASAITDKGVPTDANDSFAEMAGNIEEIHVGPDTSDATATAGDILASKTAYGAAGTKLTGTMVDRGNMSFTPGAVAQAIPAGKHGGAGQVAAVVVPADKVLAGTTIAGTAGTMPNRSGNDIPATGSVAVQGRLNLRPSIGYWNGVNFTYLDDPNFISANILAGKSVFGLAGSLIQGKAFASGSAVSVSPGTLTVTNLPFTPKFIVVLSTSGTDQWMWTNYLRAFSTNTSGGFLTSAHMPNVTSDGFSWLLTKVVAVDWIAIG